MRHLTGGEIVTHAKLPLGLVHNSYGFVVISPMLATVSPFFIEGTLHI